MGSASPPKRILMLTNSEHGQANVFLATSHALLTLPDEDAEVHFASFPAIHKYVAATSAHAAEHNPRARPIVFHALSGPDMRTAWSRPEHEPERDGSRHAQGFWAARRRMQVLLRVTLPWTGPEFVAVYDSVAAVLRRVDPHVVAVDPAFAPALTAVRHLSTGRDGTQTYPYLVLAPNTIKDFALPAQPRAEALWKYPCVGSASPFPIPARHVPLNVVLVLVALVVASLLDRRRAELQRFVAARTDGAARLTTLNDLSLGPLDADESGGRSAVKVLVANTPALEFPLSVLPPHVVPCGPMIRPARPVREVDAGLAAWLGRAPTVYVNLGTHVLMTEESAVEMATGLRVLLDRARSRAGRERGMEGLQVLWKLAMEGEGEGKERGPRERGGVDALLGRDVEAGVVRIVGWIEAEPTAVLAEEKVVCAVHHGGANSFLEAASAGIPQVVLPVWMDTFDFARRAELLGIGRWGNKTSGKGSWGGELGNALVEVLLGDESGKMRERARELAEGCKEGGGGRVVAARMILREIREPVVEGKEEEEAASQSSDGKA